MAPNVTVIDVHYDKGPEEGTTDIINCKEVILWDKTMEPVCHGRKNLCFKHCKAPRGCVH